MLELHGGKLLLASPDMEIVINGGTKMEKRFTAAIQGTCFSVMTHYRSVMPIAQKPFDNGHNIIVNLNNVLHHNW